MLQPPPRLKIVVPFAPAVKLLRIVMLIAPAVKLLRIVMPTAPALKLQLLVLDHFWSGEVSMC